jgi:hypothetical protein
MPLMSGVWFLIRSFAKLLTTVFELSSCQKIGMKFCVQIMFHLWIHSAVGRQVELWMLQIELRRSLDWKSSHKQPFQNQLLISTNLLLQWTQFNYFHFYPCCNQKSYPSAIINCNWKCRQSFAYYLWSFPGFQSS